MSYVAPGWGEMLVLSNLYVAEMVMKLTWTWIKLEYAFGFLAQSKYTGYYKLPMSVNGCLSLYGHAIDWPPVRGWPHLQQILCNLQWITV